MPQAPRVLACYMYVTSPVHNGSLNQWTGMDYWNGLLEWNTGMDYWNGILEWTTGMEYLHMSHIL